MMLADGGTGLDPEWVKALIVAIIGSVFAGMAHVNGKKKGREEASRTVATIDGQPIEIIKRPRVVTWDDHQALSARVDRMEKHLDEVRKEQSEQYRDLLESGTGRETRIMEKIDQVARAIHSRIDEHLPARRTTRGGA